MIVLSVRKCRFSDYPVHLQQRARMNSCNPDNVPRYTYPRSGTHAGTPTKSVAFYPTEMVAIQSLTAIGLILSVICGWVQRFGCENQRTRPHHTAGFR